MNWCVVSCCRSSSKKILTEKCARVCQSWHAGREIVFVFCFLFFSRLTSLWVRISVYSNSVMQVLTPSSTLILPYCPLVSPVSLRPVNNRDNPPISPVLTTTTLCNLYRLSLALSLIPLPFSLSAFKPVFPPPPPSLKRAFESGVPGRAQLSETVGFMTRRRVSLLEIGFKESRAFLKGKVETPSSATHDAFLPYKAPKYTNYRLYVHAAH